MANFALKVTPFNTSPTDPNPGKMSLCKKNERIDELRSVIREKLTPLITSDYVLLDCPYHYNIGDTLIWEGELDFLRTLPYRLLDHSSVFTYNNRTKIDPDTVILLHGGGNFGDLWDRHSQFRRKIAERYLNNRIIVLPQTVFYERPETMRLDAEIFGRHPDLTICARDRHSYEILKSNFRNDVLLVPDMAFYIERDKLMLSPSPSAENNILYIKRKDRELGQQPVFGQVNVEISDWPWSNKWSRTGLTFFILRGSSIALNWADESWNTFYKACASTDLFAEQYFRPHAIRKGVEFLNGYSQIYTTRLHGAILALMMGLDFHLLDNNYGKNGNFFRTWLTGVEGAILLQDSGVPH